MKSNKKIDFNNMELKWKQAMKEILQNIGTEYPMNYYMNTYDELIRAHKKIYGDEHHDSHWFGMGFGTSRDQLNTYLLIKNHNMLAQLLMMQGERSEFEPLEKNKENWSPKEDFEEITEDKLPKEFKKDINLKYLNRCFINSEGIYRVEIKDEPIPKEMGVEGKRDYMLDYKAN